MAFTELDWIGRRCRSTGRPFVGRWWASPARIPWRCSSGRAQAGAQLPHLGPLRSCENDADRVEHDQLGIALHLRRHLLERRLGDKMSELLDLLCHLPSLFLTSNAIMPPWRRAGLQTPLRGSASLGWAQRAL